MESVLRHAVGMRQIDFIGALCNARNKVDTLVDDLKRCFLLLDSRVRGCVKMHDVVRDVVLSISRKEHSGFMVRHGSDEVKQLMKKQDKVDHLKAVSLILQDAITNGKELQNGLVCPMLELFQARSERKEAISWPENFFQGMSKIRVLTMNKLRIPTMPSLFQTSMTLTTLQLENCDVGDVSVIGNILVELEILSFSRSNIKELPTEIGQLGSLKLLDLTGCDELAIISDNVFAKLSKLEELYFRVENFPWMLNETILGELIQLSQHLKVFEIQVRDVEILPKELSSKNLERFWIYVTPYVYSFDDPRVGYLEPNTLVLRYTSYNKSIKCSSVLMQLIKRCEVLKLKEVKDLKNVICELDDSDGFQCLTDLLLLKCSDVEYVVDCITATSYTVFPLLKSLSIERLTKLREICKASDNHDKYEFSYLEKLDLRYLPIFSGFSNAINSSEPPSSSDSSHRDSSCTNERVNTLQTQDECMSKPNSEASCQNKLFSSLWMLKFPRLETIFLRHCDSLEEVFDLQEHSKSSNIQMFPQLREIKIEWLPKLKYVWGNVPHTVDGFHNLRSIQIWDCASLRHVFTPATVKAMVNLETLKISYCNSMVALVVDEEERDQETRGRKQTIIFNKLCSLSLYELENFENLYTDSAKLEWPSLRAFSFENCPKLKTSLIATQLKIEKSDFSNSKENNSSSSFHGPLIGCMPWPLKFVHQRSQEKTASMEASLAQSQESSPISEIKDKAEISHVPILEDLHLEDCDSVEVVVLLEGTHNSSIGVTRLEKRTSKMVTFTRLVSLKLIGLPNLENFCSLAIKKQDGGMSSKTISFATN